MAHYDPQGEVAPHVRYTIEQMAMIADAFVVVSASELTREARQWLESRVRLLTRENRGYDFPSYKLGLEQYDLGSFSEVVVMNDSCIFPLVKPERIFNAMEARETDFWGLTQSREVAPHVQSFFIAFRKRALQSEAFKLFWRSVRETPDRWQVIATYELGLSAALQEAGLRMDSYFLETRVDKWVATARVARWLLLSGRWRRLLSLAKGLLQGRMPKWNPYFALPDCALDHGRLPFVKLSALRDDQYRLGTSRMLPLCEQSFPSAFAGVRQYLERTDSTHCGSWSRQGKQAWFFPRYRRRARD